MIYEDKDFNQVIKDRVGNLSIESQFFIKQGFEAINKACDEGNIQEVKRLFLDLLILMKQKEHLYRQVARMFNQEEV